MMLADSDDYLSIFLDLPCPCCSLLWPKIHYLNRLQACNSPPQCRTAGVASDAHFSKKILGGLITEEQKVLQSTLQDFGAEKSIERD
jgi:hypothetical protein